MLNEVLHVTKKKSKIVIIYAACSNTLSKKSEIVSYIPPSLKYLIFYFYDINFDHSYYLTMKKSNIIWFIT
jgi:hypothetical protein